MGINACRDMVIFRLIAALYIIELKTGKGTEISAVRGVAIARPFSLIGEIGYHQHVR